MQARKEQHPDGLVPDGTWFRAFVAKAIVFRAVQAIVKARKFPAYQANITAYTVASLSRKTGGRIDFERIWSRQSLSKELVAMIDGWTIQIDKYLRETAKAKMPTEWAKKVDCWEAMRNAPLEFPEPLPPELQIHHALPFENNGKAPKPNEPRYTMT